MKNTNENDKIMNMASVTIKISKEKLAQMREFYKENLVPNNGEYVEFFASFDNKQITAYRSNKETYKVVFSSLDEALIWDENATETKAKKEAPKEASWLYFEEQIGSDEVGVGDFFGPICVCAAYITRNDIEFLRELGVDDSKRLTDEKIRELGKILINKIEYSQCSIDNEKYNEVNEKGLNMNEIKAKLHNQVLLNLKKKHKNAQVFMDQFVESTTYYHYLTNDKEVVYDITFKTKGESYYPSIAVGSIIARYSFLQKMDALSKKYGMEIPFGASTKVNEFAQEFIKKHGLSELEKVVKKNFKNYDELTKVKLL